MSSLHCWEQTGFRSLDLLLWQINSNKTFKAVLFHNHPIFVSQILAKCNGRFLQLLFCSVRSSEPLHHWRYVLKSVFTYSWNRVTVKFWSHWVSSCSICKLFMTLKFSSVTKRLHCPCRKPTKYHKFVDIFSKYDLLWGLVPEKNCILLAAFLDKIPLSTAWHAMMVYSVRSIVLLLASFDVALPSKREKLSWIAWIIKVSPSTS